MTHDELRERAERLATPLASGEFDGPLWRMIDEHHFSEPGEDAGHVAKKIDEYAAEIAATLRALAAENAALRTERDDLDHMCKLAIAQRIAAEEQRDAAIRERDGWKQNFDVLSTVLVGNTGLSAITVASNLKADLAAALARARRLEGFAKNVATPCSEPLNSAWLYRNKDDRQYFQAELRREAQVALADTAPDSTEGQEDGE